MRSDVLIIGMGSLVQRRVLPALLTLDRVGKIHVASPGPLDTSLIPPEQLGSRWQSYEEALQECSPCLAYVSLPNSMHADCIRAALTSGHHVIVDKPAVTAGYASARDLAELAHSKSRVLAEANVWPWHALARRAKEAIADDQIAPRAVIATFTSPPMNPDNFRYRKDLGGGALLDRGSYAASCGRFFFSEQPLEVSCTILSHAENAGVDTSFSSVIRYPSGVLLSFFSLDSEYQNKIEIICPSSACSVERVFSPPSDYIGSVSVRSRNELSRVEVPAEDSFALFVDDVLDAIEQCDHDRHSSLLLEDAKVLEWLMKSADGGEYAN
ncbi:MAG: Gfo/Idh/MocA family oxidoreductase [Gaiellaceae bacterium]